MTKFSIINERPDTDDNLRKLFMNCSRGSEEHANVLKETDEENLLTSRYSPGGGGGRCSTRGHSSSSAAPTVIPLAAGYHPLPKSVQSLTDALIAASDDPSAMVESLVTELSRATAEPRRSHHQQQHQASESLRAYLSPEKHQVG